MGISRLQIITQDINGKSHTQLAEEACKAGAEWIQLRLKNKSEEEYKKTASEVKEICRLYNALLIINDNVSVAKEIAADGVHVGKNDMPSSEARRILGNKFIIGGTANTWEDILMHNEFVNYVGVGPFRFTDTKENLSPVLGINGFYRLMEQCRKNSISIPVIAIGGITAEDVSPIIETGVHGVAVASAVNKVENKQEIIKSILIQLQPSGICNH
ncbi:MAG: thiamine phosphate synthase [Cytophagaceae bacterium]